VNKGISTRQEKIEIKAVESPTDLDLLKTDWGDLFASSRKTTPFCSWAWQFGCATYLHRPQDIYVCAVYSDGLLVGLLPLRRAKISGGAGLTHQGFACLGGMITDYNALLVRKGYLKAVFSALRDHLLNTGKPIDFENVLPGSPLAAFVRYLRKNGYMAVQYESKLTLWTDLNGKYEDFLRTVPKKFKRNLRQNQNFMDRQGGYEYHRYEQTYDLAISSLFDLHTSRWEYKGEGGALASRRIQEFHRWLCSQDSLPFTVEFFTIEHENNIVAILYGFYYGRTFYAYLSGFDMAHNRISPGNMALNAVVKELFKRRADRFDMLRGEMWYKGVWASHEKTMYDQIMYPPSASGRLSYLVHRFWLALKRLVPSRVKKQLKQALDG
jgi:CelD/BcsL family acetyltransferase involved in cellulose biosynthesis